MKVAQKFSWTSSPDTSAYAALLQKCGASRSITEGKKVHSELLEQGYLGRYLANHLIQMYGRCGCLQEARSVFDWIHNRNLFSWTLMLSAYAQNAEFDQALQLYHTMDLEGVKLDSVTFLIITDACSCFGSVDQCQKLYDRLLHEPCFRLDVSLGNSLITMCGSCHSIDSAINAFNQMLLKDVVTWTAMISALSKNGHAVKALKVFQEMEQEGVKPDSVTFLALLEACSFQLPINSTSTLTSLLVHERIAACGLTSNVPLMNAVITTLGSCLSCLEAANLFDKMQERTTVSWNAMITAYARNGRMHEALSTYEDMLQDVGVAPNEITFVAVLDVCSNLLCLNVGREVHERASFHRLDDNLFVQNALIDMYGKCGSVDDSRAVFDRMTKRDIVSWTSLIAAFAGNGQTLQALETYRKVHAEGLRPDQVTFIAALEACGNLGLFNEGKSIQGLISASKLESHEEVATAVFNMYVKCGRLDYAQSFSLSDGGSCWNSQMIGLAEHGQSMEALHLFREMIVEGVESNDITFVAAVFACSHAGLLNQGLDCFALMIEFGIQPQSSHYVCVVELMSRVGEMEAAVELVRSMPYQPGAFPWMILLGSSNANLKLGNLAAKQVFEADLRRPGAYVLLSNLCASAGSFCHDVDEEIQS